MQPGSTVLCGQRLENDRAADDLLPSLVPLAPNKHLIFYILLTNMVAQGCLLGTYDDVAGAESVIVKQSLAAKTIHRRHVALAHERRWHNA
jgi:hypothetical protein